MTDGQPPEVPGFENLEAVAAGGFGAVYRAVDEHIGRVVAIKVLDKIDTSDARSRDRFLRETRAMGKLSGLANVVDIYQATFASDGRPCIVMPYLAGGSLADALKARGRLASDEVVTLGALIARALDSAHRRGISHRDIKPENILLDDNGVPGLADFGIAIASDTQASTRTRLALTPEHAPPERLAPPVGSPPPEALGDIYSLTSTLYTLLAGTAPFGSEAELGSYEFVRRVVELPAPPIDLADIPPELQAVLQRGLAKVPGDRYPTALDLALALEAVPHEQKRIVYDAKAPAVTPPDQKHTNPLPQPPPLPDNHPTRARDNTTDDAHTMDSTAHKPITASSTPTGAEGGTVIRERAPAPAQLIPDEEDTPGPPKWLTWVAIAVVFVASFGGIMLVRGKGNDQSGARAAGDPGTTIKPSVNTAAPGTGPTVDSLAADAHGDLLFTWSDKDAGADVGHAYQISVDGKKALVSQMKQSTPANAGEVPTDLKEQTASEVTVDSHSEPIDTTKHRYCVVIVRLEADVVTPGEQSCLDPQTPAAAH